ncbi:hypothetical protein V8C86DRAFT_2688629 [Haematococcus lacustris]
MLSSQRASGFTQISRRTLSSFACRPVMRRAAGESISYQEPSVEKVMEKDPVCVSPSMLVKDAARLLVDKNLTGAPVVDSAGALVGMLSEADLIWKGAGVPLEHSILPTVFIGAFDLLVSLRDKQQVEAEVAKIVARTVDQAMSKKLHSITPRASMAEAAHLMLEKNVNHLPVVEGGKLVGLVTRHDVLRGMVAHHTPMLSL